MYLILFALWAFGLIFPFYCYPHNNVEEMIMPQLIYSLVILFISSLSSEYKIKWSVKIILGIVITCIFNMICNVTGLLWIYSLFDGIFISLLSMPSIMVISWLFLEEKDRKRFEEKTEQKKEKLLNYLTQELNDSKSIVYNIDEFNKQILQYTRLMDLITLVSDENMTEYYLQYRQQEYEKFCNKHKSFLLPNNIVNLNNFCKEKRDNIKELQNEISIIQNQYAHNYKALNKKCVLLEKNMKRIERERKNVRSQNLKIHINS